MKSSLFPVQDLRRRVLAWAVKLKVNPRAIRVQHMSRKWGSCSTTGIVTLAVDLVDQDEAFQDYVIVHELLHLRYANHGRMFKALMGAHVPGWRTIEQAQTGRACGLDVQRPSHQPLPRPGAQSPGASCKKS
jgi:predicted metal-dependent hydrolase